jgi:AraC-like DNA-binding protein
VRAVLRHHTPPLLRLLAARDRLHDECDDVPALSTLARDAGLSRAHFIRSFTRAFGRSPHDYLIELRMERAKRALARGESVTEVCFAVGYESLGTFSRTFAERVGRSPRAWQRDARLALPSAELWPAIWVPGCFLGRLSTFGEALARAGL